MPMDQRYLVARKTAKDRLNLPHQITQADLAAEIGVNRLSILNIENAVTTAPRKATHEKVGKFLRVNVEWLQLGTGPMDPVMPDYTPPNVEVIERRKPLTSATDNGRYSYTPVVVISTSDDNRDWVCSLPDVYPGMTIKTQMAPTTDYELLKTQPMFFADVYLLFDEAQQPTSLYILKHYL